MRIDLEVLNSVDHIITTSTSESECVSESKRETTEAETDSKRQIDRGRHHMCFTFQSRSCRGTHKGRDTYRHSSSGPWGGTLLDNTTQ